MEMIPENIDRMAGMYHCMLYPQSGMAQVTKTRIDSNGDFIPPPKTVDEAVRLLSDDFFAERRDIIAKLFDKYQPFYRLFAGFAYNSIIFKPHEYLLSSDESRRKFTSVLKKFSLAALEYNFEPYFLILPTSEGEIDNYIVGNKVREFVEFSAREAASKNIKIINGFDIFARWEGGYKGRYTILRGRGHPSVEANAHLAQMISAMIK
jgi:hypothetical protein